MRIRDSITFVSIILLASFETAGTETQPRLATYDNPAAYEIYDALLPVLFAWGTAHSQLLVIRSDTEPPGGPASACIAAGNPDFVPGHRELIQDFDRSNTAPKLLLRRFSIPKEYVLVP